MLQRESVASSFLVPAESPANNSLDQANSLGPLNPSKGVRDNGDDPDEQNFAETPVKRTPRSRLLLILAGILIVIVAIVLGTYFGVTRKSSKASNASAGPSGQTPASPSASATPGNPKSSIVYGGDGTIVTTEQGTTFTYNNSFGGYFVVDSGNPFNNNARAQYWSPPLNQSWQFGTDQILG